MEPDIECREDHERVRQIAESLHQDTPEGKLLARLAQVGCYVTSDDCWVYQDEVVRIVMHRADPSGVVYWANNGNSVMSWSNKGTVVRWHGERKEVFQRLWDLMGPLTQIAKKAES